MEDTVQYQKNQKRHETMRYLRRGEPGFDRISLLIMEGRNYKLKDGSE